MRCVLALLNFVILCCLTVAGRAVTITGIVIDEDLHPVAGARVAYAYHANYREYTQTFTTDANGRFSLQEERSQSDLSLYGNVSILAPGYAVAGGALHAGTNVYTLCRAVSFTCLVTTEKNEPLANAPIRCVSVSDGSTTVGIPKDWEKDFSAQSDTQGNFTLANLPDHGSVELLVADRRVQATMQYVSMTPPEYPARSFMVRAGMTVRGRVLAADGTPLPHMHVISDRFDYLAADTGADGTFRLDGMSNESTDLTVSDPTQKYLPTRVTSINFVEGKDTVLKDITMQPAAKLTGVVREVETQAPVPHVKLEFQRRNGNWERITAETDAAGKYSVSTAPGTYQLYVSLPQPELMLDKPLQETVELAEAGKTLDVTLRRGICYRGVVQDEQGHPVSGVMLNFIMTTQRDGKNMTSGYGVISDLQGRFITSAVTKETTVTVDTASWWGNATDWMKLVPTNSITDPTQPMTVVVRRNVHGRVVSTRGEPLAGMHLTLFLLRKIANGSQNTTLIEDSDKNGEFPLPVLQHGDELQVRSANGDNVRSVTLGTLREENGTFSMTDTVMVRCDATLHGRVLAADGTPLAGALVSSPDGRPVPMATTDAQGNFSLAQLPPGEVTLIAGKEHAAAQMRAQTGDDAVTITLHPVIPTASRDITRVMELLQQDAKLPEKQRLYSHATTLKTLIAIDPTAANALAAAEGIPITDELRATDLAAQLQRDPAGYAAQVPTALELITAPMARCTAALDAGKALVNINPMVTEHCLALAEGILRDEKLESVRNQSIDRLYLSALLQHTDTAEQLAKLLPLVDKTQAYYSGRLIAIMMLIAPEKIDGYMTGLNSMQCEDVLVHAGTYLLQYAPTRIDRLLPVLHKYQPKFSSYSPQSDRFYTLLGKLDPVQALACAREIPPGVISQMACLSAVRYQPQATALANYREVLKSFTDTKGSTTTTAFSSRCEISARAALLDAQAGRECFADLRKVLQRPERYQDLEGCYGYAISTLDPAEARIVLESGYVRVNENRQNINMLVNYPMYMAAVDLDRALAMLTEIRTTCPELASTAGDRLLDYLLATPEERLHVIAY